MSSLSRLATASSSPAIEEPRVSRRNAHASPCKYHFSHWTCKFPKRVPSVTRAQCKEANTSPSPLCSSRFNAVMKLRRVSVFRASQRSSSHSGAHPFLTPAPGIHTKL
ncbi:hypothetical protein E2C01_060259 [Portunus trituberculatus]|uniref:Uncharacterized protein n=1 Tax=Portunus trituberculatus TaxID=210409 RepID=A0A5B7H8T1_PORTR|nr:hypothetical protein [Portunus trituberculatus]